MLVEPNFCFSLIRLLDDKRNCELLLESQISKDVLILHRTLYGEKLEQYIFEVVARRIIVSAHTINPTEFKLTSVPIYYICTARVPAKPAFVN